MPRHSGFEVVGHYHGYRAAKELEHADMAAQPGVLGHVQGGLDIGVPAERKGSHEQVDLRHPAGHGVHDRHRGPRAIDLAHAPRLVADPAGHLLGYGEVAVSPAEAVVAHGHRAGLPADVAVFGMEEPQHDADLRHLPVDVFPIGLLEHADMVVPAGEKQPVHLIVRHVRDVGIGYPQIRGGFQHLPLALLGYPVRRIHLVGRNPGLAEL